MASAAPTIAFLNPGPYVLKDMHEARIINNRTADIILGIGLRVEGCVNGKLETRNS